MTAADRPYQKQVGADFRRSCCRAVSFPCQAPADSRRPSRPEPAPRPEEWRRAPESRPHRAWPDWRMEQEQEVDLKYP
jgi:hypothetical protein